jgi:hypothetical protein
VAEAAEVAEAPERARLPLELTLEPHSDLAVSPLDEVRARGPEQPAQEQVPEQPAQERVPTPAEAAPQVRVLPVVQPARRAAAPAHDLRHRRPTAAR